MMIPNTKSSMISKTNRQGRHPDVFLFWYLSRRPSSEMLHRRRVARILQMNFVRSR